MPMYSKTVWAFSPRGRPMMASRSRNMTCPPSSPGMGRMFMTARMMLMRAVRCQKARQSQVAGKMLPMVMKDPTLWAPFLVKTYFRSWT